MSGQCVCVGEARNPYEAVSELTCGDWHVSKQLTRADRFWIGLSFAIVVVCICGL